MGQLTIVGWVERERNPSQHRCGMMGIAEFIIGRAFARPVGSTHPFMGSGLSRGVVSLAGGYLTTARRRSTTISQAATGCGQVSPGRETKARTWTGPCAKHAATTPHHLVSGRARLPGTQIFHARVKARPKEDGTHLRKRFLQTQGWVRSRVCPRLRQPFIVRGCSTSSMQRGARRHCAGR